MPKLIILNCCSCGAKFEKAAKEHARQVKKHGGSANFYCSRACTGKATSERQTKPVVVEVRNCLFCGDAFETTTGASYCSASCASRGSVTELRRSKAKRMLVDRMADGGQIYATAASLRSREASKYSLIKSALEKSGELFLFECPLASCGRIFDLALAERGVFIEFDEDYHLNDRQAEDDRLKDLQANALGWEVVRISIPRGAIPIDPSLVMELLYQDGEGQSGSDGVSIPPPPPYTPCSRAYLMGVTGFDGAQVAGCRQHERRLT